MRCLGTKVLLITILALALVPTAFAGGINDPGGVPLYVIIEVDWDGTSTHGDWTVWGSPMGPGSWRHSAHKLYRLSGDELRVHLPW